MKRVLSVIVLALTVSIVYAQHITEQQAMERALQYLSEKTASTTRRVGAAAVDGEKALESAPVETGGIYAFNIEGGGFIIASADARALPVLGYSTSGSIDWDNMPDNMRSWLQGYEQAIATLGSRTDLVDGKTQTNRIQDGDWEAVEPLVKTHWGQDEPYWNQVPKYNGVRTDLKGEQCYVGCAATALAQVMNYYQWPKTLPEGLDAYNYQSSYYGRTKNWHINALPPVIFDWDNMINDYKRYNSQTKSYDMLGTDQQNNAVATLMRYCGQALKMQYGPRELGGSAASGSYIATSLVNKLDYNTAKNISRATSKNIYEWEKIIYTELAAHRPVVYYGQSDNGGHAFVCDGYDGNGMFHINWGWHGSDDGYFSLSVLNPYNNTGAGSGSSGIGFSINEGAIIYTDPHMDPRPNPLIKEGTELFGFLECGIQNDILAWYQYTYYGREDIIADNALGTVGANGELTPVYLVDYNDSILFAYTTHDYNVFYVIIDSTAYQAGQSVKLFPMVRFREAGQSWQLIPTDSTYVQTGRDDGGKFFCTVHHKKQDIECTGGAITAGTGRLNERNDVTVYLNNNDSTDFMRQVYLRPYYYGHIGSQNPDTLPVIAKGDEMACYAYIPAQGQGEVTFSFVPQYGGTVVFRFMESGTTIGSFTLELNNDTLVNYSKYIENNSWLSKEGNEWFYNIELCDLPGVNIPYWIPSDSIGLKINQFINGKVVTKITLKDEIHEYLKALPLKGGKGNYKFTYRIPVKIKGFGEYKMQTYLADWNNNSHTETNCLLKYIFQYTDITNVIPVTDVRADESCYDLLGRPVEGIPERKGVYIKGNRKVLIR